MTHWAILTGEYPPQPGGVSDYTAQVSRRLAVAGDRVTVFAPNIDGATSNPACESDNGVSVVRLPDHFGREGRALAIDRLTADRPHRVLVQYVPHAYGQKGMNLPFVNWITSIIKRIGTLWVMFHEVAFPFVRRPLRHNLLALVNRFMARQLARAADRLFVTIPAWADLLNRLAPGCPRPRWLPVPSNLPTTVDSNTVQSVRQSFGTSETLIGHFGTYGRVITELLEPILVAAVRHPRRPKVLLLGRNGSEFRNALVLRRPDLATRIMATGNLEPNAAAAHLSACDWVVQPYPDGVSGRRTSAVSSLALGVPLVTNRGTLTESVWHRPDSGICLAASPSPEHLIGAVRSMLCEPEAIWHSRGNDGRQFYTEQFAIERTLATLREGCTS